MQIAGMFIGYGVPGDLTRIRLHLAIYFLPFAGESDLKAARRALCRIIRHLGSGIVSELQSYEAARSLGVPQPLSLPNPFRVE
jgi:hypothetical protein